MSPCSAWLGWHGDKDSLPEWSKGVDSSSTSASCVGSNPTAVMFFSHMACIITVQVLGSGTGGRGRGCSSGLRWLSVSALELHSVRKGRPEPPPLLAHPNARATSTRVPCDAM